MDGYLQKGYPLPSRGSLDKKEGESGIIGHSPL